MYQFDDMANGNFIKLVPWLLCFGVAWVAWKTLRFALSTQRSPFLPPGPPVVPFLGNLHQVPSTKAFLKFQEWGIKYGPIVSVKMGPTDMVILNKAKDIRELFDKRGAIYSSRPPNHIGTEIITRDNVHLLLMPYGQAWREQRRIYQAILSITAVGSLRPLQAAEAVLTLHQLDQSPERYYDHIRRYSTAVILSSVFGVRGPEFHHRNIMRLYKVQDQFTAILDTAATPPVDVFPILKSLPNFLTPWRRWAYRIRTEQRRLYFELLEDVKDRRTRGIKRNCFMDQLLDESFRQKYSLDDEHIAYIGGVLMEGGSDTTSSTLLSFLLAMVKYPHVLQKAQKHVDALCGKQRSPNFEDLAQLPYIKCCVSEPQAVFRIHWFKVQLMLLRMLETKKTMGEAIHHDPECYDDPDKFIPERFEQNELGLKPGLNETAGIRKTYAFGAGRRICPGSHLAENSLRINIAKVIWAFDIRAGRDTRTGLHLNAEDIDDDIRTKWTDGFLTAPKPFPVTLSLRSKDHGTVIYRELQEAQDIFETYED
ncbi:hypothetical protein N7510_006617 [Penicillium lagena]|uniref:uncharacterized protein n=1 Tax=Penicillium lagena TaxID=94218 RepID=UPI002541644C|nr:uncharacterized protein N7510_006617 [Penicillium lagena]KAJ5613423.1 hypothetical protein N7510_006617 [Penicillium lagena]